ncbi:MAG: complex I subunit 4 family protein [Bacteroidia bacterium]
MALIGLTGLWVLPMAWAVVGVKPRVLLASWLTKSFLQVTLWAWGMGFLSQGGLWTVEPWIRFGDRKLYYALALLPQNYALVILTIGVFSLAGVYAWAQEVSGMRRFFRLLSVLEGLSLGAFLAQDAVLFFVFYEATLIPAWLLIYEWGSPRRQHAANKFALYTLGGSLLVLVGILGLLGKGETLASSLQPLPWAAVCMIVGLGVKLPLMPFHGWLGDAHTEAETPLSMVLAGVLLKLGGWGILYWVNSAGGTFWHTWQPYLIWWGGVTILYSSFLALSQKELKRMIAYVSIAHMGYVLVGWGSFTREGIVGAYHQLFTHGIVSAWLFGMVGIFQHYRQGYNIEDMRGILQGSPRYAFLWGAASLAAIGLPGLNLFISELFIMWGIAQSPHSYALAFLFSQLVIGAIYFLRAFHKLYQGPTTTRLFEPKREVILWILFSVVLVGGLYPQPWLEVLGYADF